MRNERYADCCILERDRFGGVVSVSVWAGTAHDFRMNLVLIEGNLNAQRYRDKIPARHVIPLFQNNANISLFSMIMPQAIQLETLRANNMHLLMPGLPKALI